MYADWRDNNTTPGESGAHPLTQTGNKTYDQLPVDKNKNYQRRHDLIDPTERLRNAPLASLDYLAVPNPLADSRPDMKSRRSLAYLLRTAPIMPNPIDPNGVLRKK